MKRRIQQVILDVNVEEEEILKAGFYSNPGSVMSTSSLSQVSYTSQSSPAEQVNLPPQQTQPPLHQVMHTRLQNINSPPDEVPLISQEMNEPIMSRATYIHNEYLWNDDTNRTFRNSK